MSRASLFPFADGDDYKGLSPQEVFERIYRKRNWNILSSESVSGEGSTLAQTATLAKELPLLLRNLKISTLLDIPCGDFNWMQYLDMNGIQYIGGDIVAEIVEQNERKFGSASRQFLQLDLLADSLPSCDLIFCRDCLVHLSFDDIKKALSNVRQSNARFFAATHFHNEEVNTDIVTGGWRPLNLFLEPFNFQAPIAEINEQCSELGTVFKDKCMVFWRIEDL